MVRLERPQGSTRLLAVVSVLLLAVAGLPGCGDGDPEQLDVIHDAADVASDTVAGDSVQTDNGTQDVRPDGLTDLPQADATDVVDATDQGQVDAADAIHPADLPEMDTEDQDPGIPVPSFPLVQGGVSSHVIVVADDASPSEKTAAAEIQALFQQASGVNLPIVAEPASEEGPVIVVGAGARAAAFGVEPNLEELGEDGFVIKVVQPSVVIAGSPAAGTMHGVRRFLEIALNVRWIAPGQTIVPQTTDIVFPQEMDLTEKPAFKWRTTTYTWPGADRSFLAHQGENNGHAGPDAEYGAEHFHDGQAHSYFNFISPDEFWDTHPEYFSEINGQRVREATQLCLTNPDVLDIVTERMLARMASNPDAIQHNFSQMDRYNQCQCDKCRAMNELYQSEGGTQFWFVNQLANRTSQVYPDKQIGTLAYMYTEEPPVGLELHPNVAIWLCHMYPSCDSHPIRTCPDNADYKRRAEAWSELTDHLYIWHYIVDFMHYYSPFPNFYALADNIRFYRDIGVEGIFLQGMGHGGGGGEFSMLRPWFGMKLLWNPDLDTTGLIKRFLKDYYGPAWGPMYDWIVLLQNKVDDDDIHLHLYSNPATGHLPEDIVLTGEALFDEAAQLVQGDEILEQRVAVERMQLAYARFFPRNGYRIEDGWLKWNPGMATFEDVTNFTQMMNDHGFTSYREAQGTPDTMMMLYMMIGADAEVKTISNGALEVDVVPTLAGRALRITDVASGKTVTSWDQRRNLFFPFAGGYEERVGEGFDFMGWVEPGGASAVTSTGLKVTLNTMNGYKVVRSYQLDPVEPILRISTTLTNPGASTVNARLRPHMELNLGDLASTTVHFVARDGTVVDKDMEGVISGMRQGEHFYDQDAPAGAWIFSGTSGLDVTYRFVDDTVDFTWLYAYPERDGELEMEVFAKAVPLAPGESMTFDCEIEVRAAE